MNRVLLIVGLLIVPVLLGSVCQQGVKRPHSISPAELESPAYDRFFNLLNKDEVNRFGDKVMRRGGTILFTKETPEGLFLDGGKAAAAGYKAIPGSSTMALSISYNADEATDPPPMQLLLLVRKDLDEGGFIGTPGEQIIICDLERRHCEAVLESGVPERLITAMVANAADAGWTGKVPSPYGNRKIIYVEPGEYFTDVKP